MTNDKSHLDLYLIPDNLNRVRFDVALARGVAVYACLQVKVCTVEGAADF